MTSLLTGLDTITARGLILTMTATSRTLIRGIRLSVNPARKGRLLADFSRLNRERLALITEHGLEQWAATL